MFSNSSSRTLGTFAGVLGAAAFGFIPFFSKPALNVGMSPACILFYRFSIASIIILVILLMQKKQIRLPLSMLPQMIVLALFYCISGGLLVVGYKYMSGGVTGVIHFTYPIFVMLILVTFFHERIKVSSMIAIAIALTGLYFLSVVGSGEAFIEGKDKLAGVGIVLLSGLGCAGYMVGVNKTKCRYLPSLTLTFWLLIFSSILFGSIAIVDDTFQAIPDITTFGNFLGLALIATVLSNFLLVYAIKSIGSTYAAILGAVEPVTAVVGCIILFGEALTIPIAIGILLILVAVGIVVMRNRV